MSGKPAGSGRDANLAARDHDHVWDTETDEFATYTPDPEFDDPWVIHECLASGCHALRVTRRIFGAETTFVYAVAEEADRG